MKCDTCNKEGKKITINNKDYCLCDEHYFAVIDDDCQ